MYTCCVYSLCQFLFVIKLFDVALYTSFLLSPSPLPPFLSLPRYTSPLDVMMSSRLVIVPEDPIVPLLMMTVRKRERGRGREGGKEREREGKRGRG